MGDPAIQGWNSECSDAKSYFATVLRPTKGRSSWQNAGKPQPLSSPTNRQNWQYRYETQKHDSLTKLRKLDLV